MANTTKKATSKAQTEKAEKAAVKTYTEAEVAALLAKMKAEITAELEAARPSTVVIDNSTPKVTMKFKAAVSAENRIDFGVGGKYGSFYGNSFVISVDKSAFIGDFRTPAVQNMLRQRMLIVLDGLTDAERQQYGVDYRDGEYLEEAVFDKITENADELLKIYPSLCLFYREMVAAKIREDFEAGKLTLSRDVIEALNKISQKDYKDLKSDDIRKKGAFYPIIAAMNKKSEATEE